MQYKSMLGYRKGADGEPEIVPEEAKIVTRIFDMFLSGQTVRAISEQLRSEKIHIPGKKFSFSHVMVYNILRNEKYCGDSILQKTITVDCISKTRRDNMGEAPMYYVQNSHPAIISRETYHMTQAEIARRKTLAPASEKKAETVAGKYSKYALSEVLVCGECGSRYRRVTWTSGGKRVVWRCSNRLENGKKYCKMSLTVKEESLHAAIVRAINKFNSQDHAAYLALMKATIGEALGIQAETAEIDELKRRIDALNQKMVSIIQKAARDGEDIEEHESEFKEMAESIALFKQRISVLEQAKSTDAEMSERMAKIQEIIDERQAHQDVYDDSIVRQMITRLGMSSKLGPMVFGEQQDQVFLGKSLGHDRNYGEGVAELIDKEVKRLMDESFATATRVLTEHREGFTRLAEMLLEKEVVFSEDLEQIFGKRIKDLKKEAEDREYGNHENVRPDSGSEPAGEAEEQATAGAADTAQGVRSGAEAER